MRKRQYLYIYIYIYIYILISNVYKIYMCVRVCKSVVLCVLMHTNPMHILGMRTGSFSINPAFLFKYFFFIFVFVYFSFHRFESQISINSIENSSQIFIMTTKNKFKRKNILSKPKKNINKRLLNTTKTTSIKWITNSQSFLKAS